VPGAKPRYTLEFKEEAVQLVRSSGRSTSQIAQELGISTTSLRNWFKQAQIDRGEHQGLTTEERDELKRLRRENRILKQEREILKKSSSLLRQGEWDKVSAFRLIDVEKANYPVSVLCKVLKVSRSGYYAWKVRPPSKRSQQDAALTHRIQEIHQRSRKTYGSPRIHAELRAMGIRCGRKRVARLMRKAGLKGCLRGHRRRKGTTLRDGAATPAADLVHRDFSALAPNRLWVADITYIKTEEGFLYLSFVLDAYSRRLVGWSMASHLRSELVIDALEMAIRRRKPQAGLIHHSDQGVQYTSWSFGKRLKEAGIVASMGSVGSAYDNAMAESFVATLKSELVYGQLWLTRASARLAIFEYLESFYNRKRLHSALGYKSPIDYEEGTMKESTAA
jgi:putative transposase